jgi:hypothetical protein
VPDATAQAIDAAARRSRVRRTVIACAALALAAYGALFVAVLRA